jgi:hypothetical protein
MWGPLCHINRCTRPLTVASNLLTPPPTHTASSNADKISQVQAAWEQLRQNTTGLVGDLALLHSTAGPPTARFCGATALQDGGVKRLSGTAKAPDGAAILSAGSSVFPSAILTGGGAYGPVSSVQRGQTYRLSLANFPAGSSVQVELVDAKSGQAKPAVPIPSFPSTGITVDWAAPSDLDVGSQHFLRSRLAATPFSADTSRFTVKEA